MIIAMLALMTGSTIGYVIHSRPDLLPLYISVMVATTNGVWIGFRLASWTKTSPRHGRKGTVRSTRHVHNATSQVEPTPEPEDYGAELRAARITPEVETPERDRIEFEEILTTGYWAPPSAHEEATVSG